MDLDRLHAQFQNIVDAGPAQQCTFGSRSYDCLRVSPKEGMLAVLSTDAMQDYRLTLALRREQFDRIDATLPVQGDTITYPKAGGTTYRVIATEEDPARVGFRVHLGAQYGGRLS